MNRKGGAIVEAALVFPVVILSLFGAMGILMFLLDEASSQADMHTTVMYEAGRETDTYLGDPGSSKPTVHSGWYGIYRVIYGETLVGFDGFYMLPRSFEKKQDCRRLLTDERKYARYIDLFTLEERDDSHETQNIDQ